MPTKEPPEFKRDLVTLSRLGDRIIAEVPLAFWVADETLRLSMMEGA
ncbi:hypothetical protein N9C58_00145 [bacterium]|nr:hypothetical protein [bacterium]